MGYSYTGLYTTQEKILNLPPALSTSNITGVLATSETMLDDACRWADVMIKQCASECSSRTISNEEHDGNDMDVIYVNEKPLLSLVSLSIKTGDLTYGTETTTNCILDIQTGRIKLSSSNTHSTFPTDYPQSVKVSYIAGVSATSDQYYLLQSLATVLGKRFVLENGSDKIAETGVNTNLEVERLKKLEDELWMKIGTRTIGSPLL